VNGEARFDPFLQANTILNEKGSALSFRSLRHEPLQHHRFKSVLACLGIS
jgi:hypothetical protein